MTILNYSQPPSCPTKPHRRRFGASSLEMLVAFSLLTSVLAFFGPMVVQHGRVVTASRHYRLAFEELSNQLERLTSLPAAEVPAAVGELKPSEFTAARLPGAVITGQLEAAEIGQRLTLQIVWDEPQRAAAPVKMAAWISPSPPSQSPEKSP
jgi:hypothetical protein